MTFFIIVSYFTFLGMDIPTLHNVIHYGVPESLDDYVQESGRAGRDGAQSFAVVIRHSNSLRGSIDPSMKEYIKTTQCRRKLILEAFGASPTLISPVTCCDNCTYKASCCEHSEPGCLCVKLDINFLTSPAISPDTAAASSPITKTRTFMSAKQVTECRQAISDKLMSESDNPVLPNNLTPQVYPQFLDNVMTNYRNYLTARDIFGAGAYSLATCEQVLTILEKYTSVIDCVPLTQTVDETGSEIESCSSESDSDFD